MFNSRVLSDYERSNTEPGFSQTNKLTSELSNARQWHTYNKMCKKKMFLQR